MQHSNPSKQVTSATPEFHTLAQLSPVGGAESVALTVLVLSSVGGILFGSTLHPLLGGVGAFLAVVAASCVTERVIRPVILSALGRHVYQTLVNVAGQNTADEVARICVAGQIPSHDQLESLLNRNARSQELDSRGRV